MNMSGESLLVILVVGIVAGWLAGPGAPNSGALLWFAREVLPAVHEMAAPLHESALPAEALA